MKKEKIIGLGVLSLVLVAGASTVLAGNFVGNVNFEERQAEMQQQRTQMQEIFAKGTYEDWVNFSNQNLENQITQMRTRHQEMMSQITSENWAKFSEVNQLMLAGDREGYQAILEELGIEKVMEMGMGGGMNRMHGGKGLGMMGEKGNWNQNNNTEIDDD